MCRTLSLALVLLAVLLAPRPAAAIGDSVVLFPYFKDPGGPGVYLLSSRDGLAFEHVNGGAPIFEPPGTLTRDPSIAQGPDGTFHMVYTTAQKEIGYASSPDLVNWSAPRRIPVFGPADNVINSWAPELYWDKSEAEFLIVWASTDRDRFPTGSSETAPDGEGFEHRLYATTTRDFTAFSDTRLFFDPGFNVIDGMIAHDAVNDRFVMAFKDERLFDATGARDAQKDIHLAFASSAQGPYTDITEAVGGAGFPLDWVEGPALFPTEGGWRLYADLYRLSFLLADHHYDAYESSDLETWTDASGQLSFPAIEDVMRHGTPFRTLASDVGWPVPEVARAVLAALALAASLASARRPRVSRARSDPR